MQGTKCMHFWIILIGIFIGQIMERNPVKIKTRTMELPSSHEWNDRCIQHLVILMHSNQLSYVNKQLTMLNITRIGEDLHTVESFSWMCLTESRQTWHSTASNWILESTSHDEDCVGEERGEQSASNLS